MVDKLDSLPKATSSVDAAQEMKDGLTETTMTKRG